LGDAARTFELDDANGKTTQSCDVFRSIADSYSTAVFVVVPVNDVMATVFDSPVASIGGKYATGIGLFRRSAGNAIGDFSGTLAGFLICGFTLDFKSLSDVREVQIVVEFGSDPNFAGFDPAVIRWLAMDKIGVRPVLEIECDVFKKAWLVAFDSEVVMSLTVLDQVLGYVALGQQRIGGNVLASDIDGVKEGDGSFDFVGAFDFVILYGQLPYFFWV